MPGPALLNLRSVVRKFGPPWLFAPEGYKVFYAIATVCDELVQFAIEGQRAKFPQLCTPGALPLIGRDRQLRRGTAEGDEAYGDRLVEWRPAWKHAGDAYAILTQLRAYWTGYDNEIRLVNARGKWRNLSMNGHRATISTGNWNWDNDFTFQFWARVWPILYANPVIERDGTWGDGESWGDNPDQSWGSTASPEQVEDVRTILASGPGAVSAEGKCPYVIVSFDDAAFMPGDTSPPLPDGNWTYAHKVVAGVAVPARDDRAIYWPGS